MKEHTVIYKTWQINEHPNKEKCFDWIRNNWHDLGQFEVEEFAECFKALANYLQTTHDYSVCITGDRGEFLKLGEFDRSLLDDLKAEDCPLTGMHYDHDFINAVKSDELETALSALHANGEYIYSDEGLQDMCEANEYEFLENGKIY